MRPIIRSEYILINSVMTGNSILLRFIQKDDFSRDQLRYLR
jgi:hypothetical protein